MKDNLSNEYTSEPIFKGRKISQFHLDVINGMLDKILNGQINTKEALELLKKACIENNETIIEDPKSIKRCVEKILRDKPEELRKYREVVKRNSGKRNPYKGKIGKSKLGDYHEREEEFCNKIIEDYLPQIMDGRITINDAAKELSTTNKTVNRVIEEYYKKNNDAEGLENYRKSKKKYRGASPEIREIAKKKRETVAKYNVVMNREFPGLSSEEQDKQLIMKVRQEQLKEEESETSLRKTALVDEKYIEKEIKKIMDFFRSKNNLNEVYFSDEEIKYIIFRYPTIIRRNVDLLQEKLNTLLSCNQIDKKTGYGMVKSFPAIMGYESSRTKKQLELLEKENLIDAVISSPGRMRLAVESMYALIEFAKYRHHTSDLSDINRSNIFIGNSVLKRLYKVTLDDIRNQYPYPGASNTKHTLTPNQIGMATYNARSKSIEADKVLKDAKQNSKGVK